MNGELSELARIYERGLRLEVEVILSLILENTFDDVIGVVDHAIGISSADHPRIGKEAARGDRIADRENRFQLFEIDANRFLRFSDCPRIFSGDDDDRLPA